MCINLPSIAVTNVVHYWFSMSSWWWIPLKSRLIFYNFWLPRLSTGPPPATVRAAQSAAWPPETTRCFFQRGELLFWSIYLSSVCLFNLWCITKRGCTQDTHICNTDINIYIYILIYWLSKIMIHLGWACRLTHLNYLDNLWRDSRPTCKWPLPVRSAEVVVVWPNS